MEADEMLTLAEVARLISRRPDTVRGYIRYDDLPMRRIGPSGKLMISRAELEEWVDRPEIQNMLGMGDVIKGGWRRNAAV